MPQVPRRYFLKQSAALIGFGALSDSFCSPAIANQEPFRLGVNLAGAEFELIGGRWRWPNLTNLKYYLDKGFNVFRIPFRWERLQPVLDGPLDAAMMPELERLIEIITGAGAVAILDAHDYGRRQGSIIGAATSPTTVANFANFWQLIATRFKRNQLVWYNFMNEPHDMPAELNLEMQNAACLSVRAAGARATVLFSGIAWTGAHSWKKSGNADTMLGAHDPENNYLFDVHQYLDQGFGGTKSEVVPNVGSHILNDVSLWARANGKKLFLGEFGCGPSREFLAELDALLKYMTDNRDVFVGATYFAGGGGWGKNVGSSDPIDGIEKPQTLLLTKYL